MAEEQRSTLFYLKQTKLICAVMLLAMLLSVGGCARLYAIFIGPLIPPPKVEAEHLFGEKTVLVWVDISATTEQNSSLRRDLTENLLDHLYEKEALINTIGYEQIKMVRHSQPDLSGKTVQDLGKKFEADEVLYVLINQFKLHHEAGESYFLTQASGYAKVIDVASGNRLWPANQISRPFNAQEQFTSGEGLAFEKEQVHKLCLDIVGRIAPAFYEHRESK